MSIDLSFPPENQDNVSPIWGALRPAGNGKLASAGIPVTDTAAAPDETNPDKAIAKPFGAARAAEIRAIAGSEPVLNQLARRIRDAHQAVRAATANALAAALDAGDALIEAKTRVETDWEGWVEKNCRFGQAPLVCICNWRDGARILRRNSRTSCCSRTLRLFPCARPAS